MIDLGQYLIDADDRCITLYRKRTVESGKKEGTETTDIVGYYSSLFNVARKLATLKAHDAIAAAKAVTEIVDAIHAAAAVILEALEPAVTPPATTVPVVVVHPEQGRLLT